MKFMLLKFRHTDGEKDESVKTNCKYTIHLFLVKIMHGHNSIVKVAIGMGGHVILLRADAYQSSSLCFSKNSSICLRLKSVLYSL